MSTLVTSNTTPSFGSGKWQLYRCIPIVLLCLAHVACLEQVPSTPGSASACLSLDTGSPSGWNGPVLESGAACEGLNFAPDVSVDGYDSDIFGWSDGACERRQAALVRNNAPDPSGKWGGYLRQLSYQYGGEPRVCNGASSEFPGWGYVNNHVEGVGAFSSLEHAGDFETVFAGAHHAMHRYHWRYPIDDQEIDVYVNWLFATGQSNPVWSVTYDLKGLEPDALRADTRSPFGEIQWDGGEGAAVDGVGWGDRFKFRSLNSPISMDSGWTYDQLNRIPHVFAWSNGADAEMGSVQTESYLRHDAGGYWAYALWGQRDEDGPMPPAWNWTFQINQWELGWTNQSKRLGWGSNFGAVGSPYYNVYGDDSLASGYPQQSYSVFMVLGPHSEAPVETQVEHVELSRFLILSARKGSVATSGPAGIEREDTVLYDPPGYNPVFANWEVVADENQVDIDIELHCEAYDKPTFVVRNWTAASVPPVVVMGDTLLTAGRDYFATVQPGVNKLWITFAGSLSHTTRLRIMGPRDGIQDAAAYLCEPLTDDPDDGGDGTGDGDGGGGDDPDDPTDPEPSTETSLLRTHGNRIYDQDGNLWMGRGANVHDTRSCNACTWQAPDVDEAIRRIDVLTDEWKANFMRLTLESYGDAQGRIHWAGVLDDADYLEDVKRIVDHIGTKPHTYVLLSLWIDPTFNEMGWPTDDTHHVWERLVETFAFDKHVMFGLVNEPESNFDGMLDDEVWEAMNRTVAAIRTKEASMGAPEHIIAVQGTGAWSRNLGYYVDHPIEAGGGENVAYEVHVYDPSDRYYELFINPAQTLPVIIGEFGPAGGATLNDTAYLMTQADALSVPYLAWTLHMRCPPNLLVDHSGGGCGVGMPLEPTPWGVQIRDHLHALETQDPIEVPPPPPPPPTLPPPPPPPPPPTETTSALHTQGSKIYDRDGNVWVGRGANIHDTRSCNACAWGPPDVDEVLRRVDLLADDWGADFMRLTLESYGSASGRVHWAGVLDDADYLADVRRIVDHIGTKPNTYVLLSLWIDPTFNDMGWPTHDTHRVWERLVETFAFDDHVLFGLVNEPEYNFNGAQDAAVWEAMNSTVAAIRAKEAELGAPQHIVAVQGTGAWARNIGYYVNNPITASGSNNVAYEIHVYDPADRYDAMFVNPSTSIPVIIGEFGPAAGATLGDSAFLMRQADAMQIPHLAWTFHMRCPPNLLADNSGGGCGIGMALVPTEWGALLREHLLLPR